jgi:hypothetical protein
MNAQILKIEADVSNPSNEEEKQSFLSSFCVEAMDRLYTYVFSNPTSDFWQQNTCALKTL